MAPKEYELYNKANFWCCKGHEDGCIQGICKLYQRRLDNGEIVRGLRHADTCPCGGVRGSIKGRKRRADSTSSTLPLKEITTDSESDDASDDCTFDDVALTALRQQDVVKRSYKQISFDEEKYKIHRHLMPASLQTFVDAIFQAFEASTERLHTFQSFSAFLISLLIAKKALHSDQIREISAWSSTLTNSDQDLWNSMLRAAEALPALDSFLRQRAKDAARIYAKIPNENRPAAMGVWLFFDCIFRYFGTIKAIEYIFWTDDLTSTTLFNLINEYCQNPEKKEDLLYFCSERIIRVLGLHTTIAVLFEQGDGRRRTFRFNDIRLQRYNLCSKYLDHLLSALPDWFDKATELGHELHELTTTCERQTTEYNAIAEKLETFMVSLSKITLLGRSEKPSDSLGDRLCSYPLKFIMSDIYYLMAKLMCRSTGEKPFAECQCQTCCLMQRLRGSYIFMGPSPLILTATLANRRPDGDKTLTVLRKARSVLEEQCKIYFDLYCMQMLPCMWRHFLRRLSTDREEQITHYRQLAQKTFLLEKQTIETAREWLIHFGLLAMFENLPREKQISFIYSYTFLPSTSATAVRKKLSSLALQHANK